MLIREPSTFHDAVKPIVYFNCLLGMGAHRLPNTSNTAYICMQFHTAIIIFINWITIYMKFTGMTDVSNTQNTSFMALTMYAVVIYINCCITLISPLLIWYQKKGLMECVRQMPILDDTFQAIFGASYEYRKQYVRLTCQVIAIILVMSLICICDTICIMRNKLPLLKKYALTVALHYPIIVMLGLDLNFCFFVGYLQKKFRDLNDGLLVLAKKCSPSHFGKKVFVISRKVSRVTQGSEITDTKSESLKNDNSYVLHEIRKVHLELCKLSRNINRVFGIQNLLSMAISFVIVTGCSYTTYSAFVWEHSITVRIIEVIPPVVWTIIYALKIWAVNYTCWSLSSETERTGGVIYELLGTSVDKELQKEIQEFGVQMLQNPVRFNACGFFTLDHTFLQGVVGSVTTYLIILIQMSNLIESSTSNTALTWNTTKYQ